MFHKTSSGLEYEIIKESGGPTVTLETAISVHYEVALSLEKLNTGEHIDSSYARKQPLIFKLGRGQILQGLEEGIQLMRFGDLYRFILPPHLAFGERGVPGKVPPHAILYIDIKLRQREDL